MKSSNDKSFKWNVEEEAKKNESRQAKETQPLSYGCECNRVPRSSNVMPLPYGCECN